MAARLDIRKGGCHSCCWIPLEHPAGLGALHPPCSLLLWPYLSGPTHHPWSPVVQAIGQFNHAGSKPVAQRLPGLAWQVLQVDFNPTTFSEQARHLAFGVALYFPSLARIAFV
jgi:hypothetical protein